MQNKNSSQNIHCPRCEQPILSQVALAEGSRFVVRCANAKCHIFIKIIAGFNFIEKRELLNPRESNIISSELTKQETKP